MTNLVPTKAEVEKLPAPDILTKEQIVMILEVGNSIKKFIEDVESYALKMMLEQNEVFEGFKVVEGKANRRIKNQDALIEKLRADGYQDAVLFKAPQLETLTNLEKLVGKKEFNERYSDYIEKPQGALTIAPITDKRPAFVLTTAVEDFAEDLIEEKGGK